jgi:Cu+-exporting ATPase
MTQPFRKLQTVLELATFPIAEIVTMAHDLVCGMDIDPEESAGESVYLGETYYFCSAECKQKFDERPQEYVAHTATRW